MVWGMERIVEEAFAGEPIEVVPIEQHRPFDVYPPWHPLRRAGFLRHGRGGGASRRLKALLNRPGISRWLWPGTWTGALRVAVACGGPNIVPHVARSPDLGLMFHHAHGAIASRGVPVVQFGVGSCFPVERRPEAITDPDDARFLRRVFDYCRILTVRDELAQRLCAGLGRPVPLLPCPGLVAGKRFEDHGPGPPPPAPGRYVLLNVQERGANEDWDQGVDRAAWADTIRALIAALRRRHPLAFLCHSEGEAAFAERLDAGLPRLRPTDAPSYAAAVAGAVAAVCTRIHAAVALAGVGVPAVGVGTDSRLGTLRAIGLPCRYVKEATAGDLESEVERLVREHAGERERLLAVRDDTARQYGKLLREAIAR
jgi:hypothetical protein